MSSLSEAQIMGSTEKACGPGAIQDVANFKKSKQYPRLAASYLPLPLAYIDTPHLASLSQFTTTQLLELGPLASFLPSLATPPTSYHTEVQKSACPEDSFSILFLSVQWSANTTSCVSATFPVSAPALCVSLFHRCISTLLFFFFFLKFLS